MGFLSSAFGETGQTLNFTICNQYLIIYFSPISRSTFGLSMYHGLLCFLIDAVIVWVSILIQFHHYR